jgi:hypothetical protein
MQLLSRIALAIFLNTFVAICIVRLVGYESEVPLISYQHNSGYVVVDLATGKTLDYPYYQPESSDEIYDDGYGYDIEPRQSVSPYDNANVFYLQDETYHESPIFKIYVIDEDGEPTSLSPSIENATSVHWSPNGSFAYISTYTPQTQKVSIIAIELDTMKQTLIGDDLTRTHWLCGAVGQYCLLTPAVPQQNATPMLQIYMLDLNSATLESVIEELSYTSSPLWSYDKRTVTIDYNLDGTYYISEFDFENQSYNQITSIDSASVKLVAWSPDQNWFAFNGVEQDPSSTSLFVVNRQTGLAQELGYVGGNTTTNSWIYGTTTWLVNNSLLYNVINDQTYALRQYFPAENRVRTLIERPTVMWQTQSVQPMGEWIVVSLFEQNNHMFHVFSTSDPDFHNQVLITNRWGLCPLNWYRTTRELVRQPPSGETRCWAWEG